MVLVVGHKIYPLSTGQTALEEDDYAFLRRFLDATKANLFFARGLIIVEGDAENLLIPAIARKLGRPLSKHGVSIVKVGHVGLFRYSRIFKRPAGAPIPIPVALVPDRDIPPDVAKTLVGSRLTEGECSQEDKEQRLGRLRRDEGQGVRAFPAEQWTLEFDLARQPELAAVVHQAVMLAKETGGRTREAVMAAAAADVAGWQSAAGSTPDTVATPIYEPLYKGRISKAQVAEQLAQLIDDLPDTVVTFEQKCPPYIVSAVRHATQFVEPTQQSERRADPDAGSPARP
jgi:putative ATP-dependent endonuclease of OLD family